MAESTMPARHHWWRYLLVVLGVLIVAVLSVMWYVKRPVISTDPDHPKQFVQADFIDVSRITSISKFRSGSGHDYSYGAVGGETCRSMKHYFQPPSDANSAKFGKGQTTFPTPDPATGIPIYSPVDGTIASISEEHTPIGKQFSIRPTNAPEYNVRLFHVYPVDGIREGMKLTAGQRLGTLNLGQGTDIAIEVETLHGKQYYSYFQVIPDTIFAAYQARGLASRDDVIISKAYRDAHPLKCNGEEFAENYDSTPDGLAQDYVFLSGYQAPVQSQQNQQQGNQNQSGSGQQSTPAQNYGNNVSKTQ